MRDRRVVVLAAAVTAHHLVVGSLFGLGDAEALYVVYGRHLQGGYLDHPPLVGWVLAATTALLGTSPTAVRLPAALLFGASVLLVDAAARRLGGSSRAGLWAAGALLCIPMFFAGSLATTPDVVVAPLCLVSLLTAWRAIDSGRPTDALLAGAVLGLAMLAKVTAVLLAPGLVWLALRRGVPASRIALAAVVATVVASPVVAWNASHGAAMLVHRFVWTQQGAGPSLRNLGALVGGQLAYVGPPMLLALGAVLARSAPRSSDAFRLPALPALAGVVGLCLCSRVAEPHWTATALLPLVVGLGLRADEPASTERRARRLRRFVVGWAVVTLLVLHVVVLTPVLPALLPDSLYDARVDLANELSGWPTVASAVRAERRAGERVAAGHYTMCAQLEVALGSGAEVTCLTREVDDWDLWDRGRLPADTGAIFVTDARFPTAPEGARRLREVLVRRGGRVVRRFLLWRIGPAT